MGVQRPLKWENYCCAQWSAWSVVELQTRSETGDAISPYLFVIVANVLQHLIKQVSRDGLLSHPIIPSLSYPILQYVDDNLILNQGGLQAMMTLKSILDQFSLATGLDINFHKSTFLPMHISSEAGTKMANIIGCQVSQFPQTYLGLPLSPHKLRVSDFQLLVMKFDLYLSGWKAKLLSAGGCLVWVNAVLSSLSIYFMSFTLLPK